MVELNKNTTIVPVEKPNQLIPMHWFNLVDSEELHKKVDRDVNLTDVFGCLMALQPIEEITVQNIRVEKKRDLKLQNIRGEQVTITLWAETTTSFQEDALQSLSPPVFIVLTSLKVKKYKGKPVLGSTGSTVCIFNPDIPQLSKYKQEFEYLKTSIEILQTSAEKYGKGTIMADSEQKTIEQLLLLDPALNKNTSFVCQATIVDYDLTRGWWYKSCPYCHKNVKNTYGTFRCFEHGPLEKMPESCKHDEGSQPLSTNSAKISAEFSNLVVPKIEPADKTPISALRSKSQTKKIKDMYNELLFTIIYEYANLDNY
ncbi:hypothetical protein C1H46_043562 [Malus baccata]|uniref:Replication protein A OB domain-containing protein n=1 Tax=Malus baccata TaxID=106549 RepID=A0A540K9L3_MALBA|nr:hypothetical protein C1H46_043562 [Malus baccata]